MSTLIFSYSDIELHARADMPTITTLTSSTLTLSTLTLSSSTSSSLGSLSSLGSAMPGVTSLSSSTGMPGITTSTSSSATYSTPSVGVPNMDNNPFILRTSQPMGTVFIAVGTIVSVILVVFALFHLINSLAASSLAKRAVNYEKVAYEKFAQNNNMAYGGGLTGSNSAVHNTEYQGSSMKVPLMGGRPSASVLNVSHVGEPSISYSDSGAASHHDLTKMFVSPTKDMSGTRARSYAYNGSVTNVSLYGRSISEQGMSPGPIKMSSTIPSKYINESSVGSDYSIAQMQNSESGERQARDKPNPLRATPSMYLEDLIDNE